MERGQFPGAAAGRRGLPPGPELSPARQTARLAMRPLAFLEEQRRRFGDVFTVRVSGEAPWVMVGDPEPIREVFRAPGDVLHAGEAKRGVLAPLLGESSVLLLDEGPHARQRRLLLPPFGPRRVERHETAMRAAAERALAEWPLGQEAETAPRTRAIALEAILYAVFGVGGSERLPALREALGRLRFPDNAREGHTPAYRRRVEAVDGLLYAEIAARAAKPDREEGDVLSLLLDARHEDGSAISPGEIRDELLTLLIAGHETTANALAWALQLLAHHPQALAATEVEAGEGGGPYTDAVVKETLRLRPPVPTVVRLVKRPFGLEGQAIPPGVTIRPAPLLVHHRADIYPEPHIFRPERFLEGTPDPGAWLPFGGGDRRCIGARFALLEARVVLAALLSRATLRHAEGEPEPMRNRDLTLTPARGARVTLERR